MDLNKLFNQSRFDQYAAFLKSTNLSDSSIQRKLSSLASFQKFLIKKKLINSPSSNSNNIYLLPKNPQSFFSNLKLKIKLPPIANNLRSNFLFRYIVIFSLFVISAGLGFTLYRQAVLQSQQNLAYSTASAMITGGRFLSFQGRLTDTSGNPIISSTSIVFKLYPSAGSDTALYTSQTGNSQTVVPDENGIFSVTIGKSHGTTIPSSVFSENAEVWLEITAGGETMSPRQQIATVGYALNSETLQGLPPSASGTKNTVLVIDGTGNLNLGETSPTIKSTSGTLGIEGQAVLIKASDGSGGNITINPDSNGVINLITEGTGATGFINATNANLASGNLFNASINNTNRSYNFINFSNYNLATTTLVSRFSVDAYGNTIIGNNLTVGGTFVSVGSTNLVTNLNSDLLDGYHSSYFLSVGSTGSLPYVNDATNSTLTRSGSGPYTLGLNLGNSNTWTGVQTFNATGAPFAVGSSNLVTNLNSDLLDGYHSSRFIYTASNGLSLVGQDFRLGGTLSQNTDIGFSGFSLTFSDGGSTFASFSAAGNTFYNPTSFTSSGDVSIAYDLNFTNSTGSNINTAGPFSINAGEVFNSSNLTLKTYNSGQIILDSSNIQALGNLTVGGTFVSVGSTNLVTNLNANYLNGIPSSGFVGTGSTGNFITTLTNGVGITITGSGSSRNIAFDYGTSLLATGNKIGLNFGSTNTWTARQTFGNVSVGGSLAITQGAQDGYILTSDASGNSYWAPNTGVGTIYFAGSGLTLTGTTFKLGGALTENTNLTIGNTSAFFINSTTGNIGIGTTNPTSGKIVISSDGASNGLSFYNGTGDTFRLYRVNNIAIMGRQGIDSYGIAINNSGNVGIGTTNPTSKLTVAGNGNISSSLNVGTSLVVGTSIELTTGSSRSLSYYGSSSNGYFTQMQTTATGSYGTYGPVTGDWALYNRFSGANTRGWIWQLGTVNIAGLNGKGDFQNAGNSSIGGTLTIGSIPLISNNNKVLTTNGGVVSYIDTTNWDTSSADDYTSWTLQADGTSGTNIGNTATVNFIGGTNVTLSKSGNTITINSTKYSASNGLSLVGSDFRLGGTLSQNTDIGFSGFSLTFSDGGNTLVSFSSAGNTFYNPTSFTSSGDVSIAYDLNFTNSTASYIRAQAQLYIQTESPYANLDINLTAANAGQIYLNSDAQLTKNLTVGGTFVSVGSTNLVTNLNSDYLDGYNSSNLPYVNAATNTTLTRTGTSGPYTLGLNLGNPNTWTGLQTFNATGAPFAVGSSVLVTNLNAQYLNGISSNGFVGVGQTGNFITTITGVGISVSPTSGTSRTLTNMGIINANANGTLTRSGSLGAYTLGLNLGSTNTWTAKQTFGNLTVGGTLAMTQGAANGYILSSDASGNAKWVAPNASGVGTSYAAGVGLTLSSSNIFSVDYDSTLDLNGNKISLNTGNANTWTALQNFSAGATVTNLTITGNGSVTGNLSVGKTLIVNTLNATKAQSTTVVTNLNADLLDGISSNGFVGVGQTGNFITTLTAGTDISITGSGVGRTINDISTLSSVTGRGSSTSTMLSLLGGAYFGSTNQSILKNDGSVGIGTTNPTQKLTVSGNIYSTNTVYASDFASQSGASIARIILGTGTDKTIYFNTNATNQMVLNGSGNVGIGTTNPTQRLSVNGNALVNGSVFLGSGATDNLYLWPDTSGSYISHIVGSSNTGIQLVTKSNSSIALMPGTGSVGIGTTNPGQKLDVVGNIRTNGQLISTVAQGTAPLSVGSSTLVTNLNADLLDGYHYNNLPYDNYNHWKLQTNSSGTTNVLTGNTVNFINGVGISLVQSGSTITVNNSGIGTTYSAGVGLSLSSSNIFSIDYDSTLDLNGNKISLNTGNANTWTGLQTFNATGAPFAVGSSTLVTNLNADLLDGISSNGFVGVGQTGNFITTLTAGTDISITGSGIGRTINDTSTLSTVTGRGSSTSTMLSLLGGAYFGTAGATQGIWKANGTVGIGTTNPGTYSLKVMGTAWINSTIYATSLVDANNGNYFIDPNNSGNSLILAGNVGIGTTAPGTKLDVIGSIRASSYIDAHGIGSGNGLYLNWGTGGYANFYGSSTADRYVYLAATDAGIASLNINNGNLSVGGTSSTYKFNVNGNANIGTTLTTKSLNLTNTAVGGSNIAAFLGTGTSGLVGYISTTGWDKNASDDYTSWTLQANGANGSSITSGSTVNFIAGTNIGLTKSGNSITINNTAAAYTASNGLSLVGQDFRLGGLLTQNTDIGLSGFSLTFSDGGNTLVSFSSAGNTFYNPTTFTSSGDVSIAYDLNFTNSTGSNINTAGPFSINAGEVFNSSNLTLKTYNAGKIILDSSNLWTDGTYFGIGTTAPTSTLSVNGNGDINNLTINGTSGTGLNISNNSLNTDISLQNGETIDNDTDGRINFSSSNLSLAGTTFLTNARLFQAGNGTVSTPAYSFSADTNTGMYRIGDDNLGIGTSGILRLTIAGNGNVGITKNLTVGGTLTTTTLKATNAQDTTKVTNLNADLLDGYDSSAFGRLAAINTWTQLQTFTAGIGVSGTTNLTNALNVGGTAYFGNYVGIGTATPTKSLQIGDASNNSSIYNDYLNTINTMILESRDNNDGGAFIFRSNKDLGTSDLVKITQTGSVGIGTTNPTSKLTVIGNGSISTSLSVGTSLYVGTIGTTTDNNQVLTSTSGIIQTINTSAWDKNASDDLTTSTNLFVAKGDNGTIETINVGNTLNISGGSGLTSTGSSADKITLNIGSSAGISVNADNIGVNAGAGLSFSGTQLINSGIINANANGTLTRSGSVGAYTLGLNLASANTWTAKQTFNNGIGVSGAETLQSTSSEVVHYKNLASFNFGVGNTIGTLKITMPKSWSSTMGVTTIKGYNYNSDGEWEVNVSGYNYSGGPFWTSYSARIDGDAPFNQVRLAYDVGTSKNVILIGTTATSWSYPKAVVTDFIAGHSNIYGWDTGWTMAITNNEVGITNSVTTTIQTYLSTSGNFGINTVSPSYKLDVNGTGRFTGNLFANSNLTIGGTLTLTGTNTGTGTTALFIGSNGTITKRALGDLAFTNNSSLGWVAKASANQTIGTGITLNFTGVNGLTTTSVGTSQITFGLGGALNGNTTLTGAYNLNISQGSLSVGTTIKTYNLYTNGNVGIGTSSPVNGKLEINGEGAANGLTIYNGSGTTFRMYRINDIGIIGGRGGVDTAGIAINVAGSIGIGTTAPAAKLDIAGGSILLDATQSIYGYNAGTGSYGGIELYNGGTGNLTLTTTFSTGDINLLPGSSGYVGIGTTAPGQKLDVVGNIRSNGQLISTVAQGTAPLSVGSSTVVAKLNADLLDGLHSSAFEVPLTFTNGLTRTSNDIHLGGALTNDTRLNIGNTEVMFFKYANGNVGIGTTNPVYGKLQINQTGDNSSGGITVYNSSSNLTSRFWVSNNGVARIDADSSGNSSLSLNGTGSGYVGIGTTNPGQKLDVVGSIRTNGQLISTVAQGTAPLSVGSSTVVSKLNADLLDGYHYNNLPYDNYNHWKLTTNGTGSTNILTGNTVNFVNGVGISLVQSGSTVTIHNVAGLYTASNGLSLVGNDFRLGGLLTQNTDIGLSGFSLTFSDGGNTLVSFSSAGNTFYNPTTFTSSGDVSIAYDLNFTNSTASYIRAQAPLYIQTESPYANLDINLTAANAGQIYLNSDAQLTKNLTVGGTFVSVGSTNLVTNLNSDYLDGYNSSNLPYVNAATNTTLTRTGTSGPYTLGLNLGNPNTWTGLQTFNAGVTTTNITITGNGSITGNLSVGGTTTSQSFRVTANGTAALPAFSWNSDNNNGLYRIGTDNIALSTAGSMRLQLAANGSVGVGTTYSGYLFNVNGNARIGTTLTTTTLKATNAQDTTLVTNLNADLLDGVNSSYFTRRASTENSMISSDTRNNDYYPMDRNAGLYADFKGNSTDGLSDGGSYHGVLTFRSYGSTTDLSGGNPIQIAYTENGNLWTRMGVGISTWGSWYKTWNSNNDGIGSSLDADLIDGLHASAFISSATNLFVAKGDNGTLETINVGNTINFAGGSGLTSTGSSPDTITFNIGSSAGISVNADNIGVNAGAGLSFSGTQLINSGIINANANDTLTRSGSVGAYTLGLNLNHANTWTQFQTFNSGVGVSGATFLFNDLNVGGTGYFGSLVGIGTASPTKKLDVVGDIKLTGQLFVGTGFTGAPGQVLVSTGVGLSWTSAGGGSATNGLSLYSGSVGLGGTLTQNTQIGTSSFSLSFVGLGNTQSLYLGSNGYVGIGTTSPTARLTVLGDGSSATPDFTMLNANGTVNLEIRTGLTDRYNTFIGLSVGSSNSIGSRNTGIGYQSLSKNTTGSDNTSLGTFSLLANTTGSYNTAIGDYSLNHNLSGANNTAIGSYSLDYNSNGANNTALGAYSLFMNTSGSNNTAIGTNSLLNIISSYNNTAIGSDSLSKNYIGSNNIAIGTSALGLGTTLNANIAIGNNAGVNLSVGSSNIFIGNGVGTSGSYDNRLYIGNGQNPIIYGNLANGSVGIGTTNPAARLTVLGDGSSATSDFTMLNANGTVNLEIRTGLTDRYNTFIGAGVGALNTTTGNANTAIGYYAFNKNISGQQNTAMGYYSLLNNTGSYNTAYGAGSLAINTSGNYNTAIGQGSLYSNSNGGWNTALGYNSLNANTSGQRNTALSNSSLSFNTTGNNNTSAGYASLYRNSTGENNTAIGYYTLAANTTGSFNTAIGTSALQTGTTLNSNIAIGYQAGYNLSVGSSNIFIGNGVGASGSFDNRLYIGNGQNPIIYGNLSNGYVGIGTTNPISTLSVNGNGDINNLTIDGTSGTGLNFSSNSLGTDISLQNNETIDNDTDGRINFSTSDLSLGNTIFLTNGRLFRAGNGTVSGPAFSFSADTNTGMYRIAEDNLGFSTNSTLRLQIAANGKVGIGATSSSTFNVVGDISTNGNLSAQQFLDIGDTRFFLNPANTSSTSSSLSLANTGSIRFNYKDNGTYITTGAASRIQNFGTGLALDVGTSNSGTVTWNSNLFLGMSGNVGIGTTAPNYKLQVVGNGNFTSNLTVGGTLALTQGAANTYLLQSDASGNAKWVAPNTVGIGTSYSSNNGITKTAGNIFQLGGALTQNTRLNIGNTEVIYFKYANGNVGIGTTNPTARLTVLGDGSSATSDFTLLNNDGSVNLEIRTDVEDNYNTFIGVGVGSSNSTGLANTGLGYKALLSNISGWSNTALGYYALSLHTSGNYNTAIGTGAAYKNVFGEKNTAIGQDALGTGTTLNSNIGIGYKAGYNLSIGSSNIFIGNDIGAFGSYSNRLYIGNGQNPIIYGDLASGYVGIGTTNPTARLTVLGDGSSATSDFTMLNNNGSINLEIRTGLTNLSNIFIGTGVGQSNTTGYSNTAIGTGVLSKNTTGFYNTSVGSESLFANTTGKYNTAFGLNSISSNTTGSYNTGIGYYSMGGMTSGDLNTALGHGSLYQINTGSNNTVLGTFALSNALTASSNIALGNYAGRNFNVGSSNIFIGNNNGASGSYDNRLYIGNGQNPIIYGNLANGNVGIGTTNPGQKLEVSGNIKLSGSLYLGTGDNFAIYKSGNTFTVDGEGGDGDINTLVIATGVEEHIKMGIGAGGYNRMNLGAGGIVSFFSSAVGIGTTSPGQLLTLAANSNSLNSGYLSTGNILLSNLEGGAYFGSVGVKENQWGLSGYGDTWTAKDFSRAWWSIAMSSDGKIQTATVNSGYIYNSTDYGNTWVQKTSDETRAWRGVAMSSDGKIQAAVVDGGQIYVSTDYGTNWTAKASTTKNWGSIAMSSDGKIQTAVVYGGQIYVSSDYGNTWTAKESSRQWASIAMSSDGKIQTAVVHGGQIYVSTDYGNTWTAKASILYWWSVAMSSDGKIQTAVVYGGQIYVSAANSYINGYVGIGTTAPGTPLAVAGLTGTTSGSYLRYYNNNFYYYSSSARYKDNIEVFDDDFSKILNIEPKIFTDKVSGERNIGFIAEEMDAAELNHLVTYKDDLPDTVEYQLVSVYLLQLAKQQKLQIDNLNKDLTLTSTGQINVDMNVSDEILSSLGYEGAKNEIEAATYSLTDNLGNTVSRISQFSEIASAKIKTGLLSATNIITKNMVAEKIVSPKANIDHLTATDIQTTSVTANEITTDNLTAKEATVSTLYADNIISKEGSIGELMTAKVSALRDELKQLVTSNQEASSSTTLTGTSILSQSSNWSMNIASDSAKITGDLELGNNLIVGANLTIHGNTQLGNAFISGTFTAGEIAIKDNFIETTNTALYIQPSQTGSVHIMGDTLVIAEDGNIQINGNLTVYGSLMANLIVADQIQTNKLTSVDIGTSNITSDSIKIATDSATTIIAESGFGQIATSSAQLTSNATAGTATLPANKTEIVITNNKITSNSMVYLTPVGSTNNQVPYIKTKMVYSEAELLADPTLQNYFTIALDNYLDKDIDINWWIIN